MSVKFPLVFISGLLLLVSCSSQPPSFEMPPSPVEIAEVVQKDIPIYLETIGTVTSPKVVQIRPQVGGILKEAHIKQGQMVKQGDLLYSIDPSTYKANVNKFEAALEREKAQLEHCQKKLVRFEDLLKKEYASQLTVDELMCNLQMTKAQIQMNQAELDLAKIQLSYCSVCAPISGRISLFQIDQGNLVDPNDKQAITEIRQISPIDVRFSFPQQAFNEIQEALLRSSLAFHVRLAKESLPIGGTVYFVDNHIDQKTGTILLKGAIPNEKETLWPGQFVRVELLLKNVSNALLVPLEAIQRGQEGAYVYIVKPDETVDLRLVETGDRVENLIVIEKGVSVGEKVVTTGQINLHPGSKVYEINSKVYEINSKVYEAPRS